MIDERTKYIVISMETLRVDLVKKDLKEDLVPFDIIDSIPNKNYNELVDNLQNMFNIERSK